MIRKILKTRNTLRLLFGLIFIFTTVNICKIYWKQALRNNYLRHGGWRNLSEDQLKKLSNLGRILFLEETPPPINNKQVPYQILIWQYGNALSRRHIRNKSNPFQGCSVQNCILTYDSKDVETADLVVIHLQRTSNLNELPVRTKTSQIWGFIADESPPHTFNYAPKEGHALFNNVFNWSINYKMISDVPVPYGRAISLQHQTDKINIVQWNDGKKQDVIVAVLMSHCIQKRTNYVKELNKTIKVDFYGNCGNLRCDGRYWTDCAILSQYKFYLSFENSYCDEYLTEKLWWNGYSKNAIPIVMGPSKSSLNQVLPANSYIDVNDFSSPRHLGEFLLNLNSSLRELEKFFEWKRNFQVLNEHGYFQSKSVHYCRMCEALNYNSKETKIYDNLPEFFNLSECRP